MMIESGRAARVEHPFISFNTFIKFVIQISYSAIVLLALPPPPPIYLLQNLPSIQYPFAYRKTQNYPNIHSPNIVTTTNDSSWPFKWRCCWWDWWHIDRVGQMEGGERCNGALLHKQKINSWQFRPARGTGCVEGWWCFTDKTKRTHNWTVEGKTFSI